MSKNANLFGKVLRGGRKAVVEVVGGGGGGLWG